MVRPDDPTELLYSPLASDPDLADIVELFVQEMPERTAKLRDRFSESDWEGLRRRAHRTQGRGRKLRIRLHLPRGGTPRKSKSSSPSPRMRSAGPSTKLIALCRTVRAGTRS